MRPTPINPDGVGVTWHTEPAFHRAYALLGLDFSDVVRPELLPILIEAHHSFTDHGRHLPTVWLKRSELALPKTTTAVDLTREAVVCVDELSLACTDLAEVLRYSRVGELVHAAQSKALAANWGAAGHRDEPGDLGL